MDFRNVVLEQKKSAQTRLINYFLKNNLNCSMVFDYEHNKCTFNIYSNDNVLSDDSVFRECSLTNTYDIGFNPNDRYLQNNVCFDLIHKLCESANISIEKFYLENKVV